MFVEKNCIKSIFKLIVLFQCKTGLNCVVFTMWSGVVIYPKAETNS